MTNFIPSTYEVETRFRFLCPDEVWDVLPMFQSHIRQEVEWHTIHYGQTLFKADQILRINHTIRQGKSSSSLGWKEPDQGKSVNIRIEIEEAVTQGIQNSNILTRLGCDKAFDTPAALATELVSLGHPKFMEFFGRNLTGEYEPHGFHLKLMLASDPFLGYPLLFEIEKTAHSPEQAAEFEKEITEFVRDHRLEERVIREEPPTLLYRALHLA